MPRVSCIAAALALVIGTTLPFKGSGDVLPPGQLKEQWRRKFDSLNQLHISQDPHAIRDPRFFVELAKSAYHCDELEVGVIALQSAADLDPLHASEWAGMECDLHFYRSRLDGTALTDVAQCLNHQMELDSDGKATSSNPSFWESYSRILLDLGRHALGTEALERSLQASAAVGEGGQIGTPDPKRRWLLGKAYLTADNALKALEVLEPYLDVWRVAFEHAEFNGLSDELPSQSGNATAVRAARARLDSLRLDWVASAWHDASLAHIKLGQISQALWRCQVALQLEPDHDSPHAENYHQTLARIYGLELGRLDLARASLWGLAGLNRNSAPASSFLRRGFDEAADHFKRTHRGNGTRYDLDSLCRNKMRFKHSERSSSSNDVPPSSMIKSNEAVASADEELSSCQVSSEDEVRLHQLALLSAYDPAYYFTVAALSPCARNLATDQCFRTEHMRLPESDPNWGNPEPCYNCRSGTAKKKCNEISTDEIEPNELEHTLVDKENFEGIGQGDCSSGRELNDSMAEDENYEYRAGGAILIDEFEGVSPQKVMTSPASINSLSATIPKAAIVYLCCADEREAFDLGTSLALLRNAMGNRWRRRYPVLVLHDFLAARHMDALHARVGKELRNYTSKLSDGLDLHFHWLAPHDWQGKLPDDVSFNATNKLFGYGMGYRHMCRFFSGPPLADLPALKDFDFVLRLDTDSFLLGPLRGDPIRALSQGQFKYGYLSAFVDQPYFTTNLWAATDAWLNASRNLRTEGYASTEDRDDDPGRESLARWLQGQLALSGGKDWNDVRYCFATNFFVLDLNWVRSPAYRSFFAALENSGGFYKYRWGDACVQFLAVATLLTDPANEVLHFKDMVPYWHQGTVLFPEHKGLFSHVNF